MSERRTNERRDETYNLIRRKERNNEDDISCVIKKKKKEKQEEGDKFWVFESYDGV